MMSSSGGQEPSAGKSQKAGHVGVHLFEGGEAVAPDAHCILDAKVQDQVTAVAGGHDENVRPGSTLENVVAL